MNNIAVHDFSTNIIIRNKEFRVNTIQVHFSRALLASLSLMCE